MEIQQKVAKMNEYGLDSDYFKRELQKLSERSDRYTPIEMSRALLTLEKCTNGFSKCKICGGHNTKSMKHDASRWFCNDCNDSYLLAE